MIHDKITQKSEKVKSSRFRFKVVLFSYLFTPHPHLSPLSSSMEDYKSIHIPAFGNWEYEDGLPITQYFETARQAGLRRYNYEQGDLYAYTGYYEEDTDLYLKPTHTVAVVPPRPRRKSKTKDTDEKIYYEPHVKEQKKQRKVYDVEQTARQHHVATNGGRTPKAVDEDLYKIPPELLYAAYPKKNKVVGFFSKCLKPSCAA